MSKSCSQVFGWAIHVYYILVLRESCTVIVLEGVQAYLDNYQLNVDAQLFQKQPTLASKLAAKCRA